MKNFGNSLVATAPAPAASGTTLTLTGGTGSLFENGRAVIWPANVAPSATNAEIVQITGISGDILTVQRAQESTSARSIASGWNVSQGLSAGEVKAITDQVAAVGSALVPVAAGAKAGQVSQRALGVNLIEDRPARAITPTITLSSTAPASPLTTLHPGATGTTNTPLIGTTNTAEFTFLGGNYMKGSASFPQYNGARKWPLPAYPQGYGSVIVEWMSDAPQIAFQHVQSEGGSYRIFVDGTEMYRLGPTIRQATAQAGAATTITLDASASAVNGFYVTRWIKILSGTGAGQEKQITAYVGSTKVATVDSNWTTTPDSTSVYAVSTGRRDNNNATGNGYATLSWNGERRFRRYRVETFGMTFLGCLTTAVDTVMPTVPSGGVPCFWFGDSFSAGTGADCGISLAYLAAARMGWDFANMSIGGTGWLNPNSGLTSLNFADRIMPPVNSWWIGGGRGSSGGTMTISQSGLTTAAIANNASVATIQSAVDATFGSGKFLVAGDGGNNFYLIGKGSNASLTDPLTVNFALTGGNPFYQQYLGDLAPALPLDGNGNVRPFVIVLAGGHNDTTSSGYTTAALTAQVSAILQYLTAKYPMATIFVVGNMYLPGGSAGLDATTSNAAILAACQAYLPEIDGVLPFVDTLNPAWFSGTGAIGSQTGTGNSDVATTDDRVHPSPFGHAAYGYRLAAAFTQILTGQVNH